MEEKQQKLFDFHCIPGGQLSVIISGEPLEYYAICGTSFEHRTEYISFIWFIIGFNKLTKGEVHDSLK